MRATMRLLLLSVLTLTLVGCDRSVRPPIDARADVVEDAPRQIAFSSDRLRRRTAVGTPQVARDDAGNLLYVTVPIRSAVNRPVYVDYRYAFFDDAGQQVYQSGWQAKPLEANVPDQVTFNSVTDRAADFRVDFRLAK